MHECGGCCPTSPCDLYNYHDIVLYACIVIIVWLLLGSQVLLKNCLLFGQTDSVIPWCIEQLKILALVAK